MARPKLHFGGNVAKRLLRISKISWVQEFSQGRSKKGLLGDQGPQRDPKAQEILAIQIAKRFELLRCQNCQKVLDVKNPRASLRDLKAQEIHAIQIAKRSELLRCQNCQKVLDVKNPRAPPRDPKVQEIHAVQVTKRSKCPRASSRSQHYQKPSFSSQSHFLYCKRPIIGANEPSIVKENCVQARNQRKGPSCIVKHIMKVSVTCQSCALILHYGRNSPR